MTRNFRKRLYQILERGRPGDRISIVVDWALIVLIVANVAAVAAETVAPLHERYAEAFWLFEVFSVAVFTIEYLCRLWVSSEQFSLTHQGPIKTRLKFALSPYGIIDLLAILPFYLGLMMPTADLRVLRVFRLLRLLKLARYSPALSTLWQVVVDERRALTATLIIMGILLFASSTAIYHAEHEAQPDKFGSIPAAMWWAIATLTTVGYGDVVPVTTLGRLLGGIVMLLGLAMFALPVGIIASRFAGEIRRRDFVVTLSMVSRVPIFTRLDAVSVAHITGLLRARAVSAGTTIFRKGDSPDAMYFIESGEVEVDLRPKPMRLGDGDFFGEIGLLRETPRMATVRAVGGCRLLVLDKQDFNDLLESDDDLRQAFMEAVAQRLPH